MENTTTLQDKLLGALIGLARATQGNEDIVTANTDRVMLEGLASIGADDETLAALIQRASDEKRRLIPLCFECAASCGRNDDYDMRQLRSTGDDVRSLKSLILLGLQSVAAYAQHDSDPEVAALAYKALFAVGMDDWGADELLPVAREVGEAAFKYIAKN